MHDLDTLRGRNDAYTQGYQDGKIGARWTREWRCPAGGVHDWYTYDDGEFDESTDRYEGHPIEVRELPFLQDYLSGWQRGKDARASRVE